MRPVHLIKNSLPAVVETLPLPNSRKNCGTTLRHVVMIRSNEPINSERFASSRYLTARVGWSMFEMTKLVSGHIK